MSVTSDHLSKKELLDKLQQANALVEVGAVYAHYHNGTLYKVTGFGIIEATQEVGVLYQTESEPVTWIRPLNSWLEKVSIDNLLKERFRKKSK